MKKKLGKKFRNSCETVETYKGCGCYTTCSCTSTASKSDRYVSAIQKKMVSMVAPGIAQ